jgi:capsid protein
MTDWRLARWTLRPEFGGTGELRLPAGMTVDQVSYRWVPRGVPWWKPQEELDTALRSVAAGLKSMQDVCDEFGLGDYLENVDEITREREELADRGFLQKWSDSAMVRLATQDEMRPTV